MTKPPLKIENNIVLENAKTNCSFKVLTASRMGNSFLFHTRQRKMEQFF